MEKLEFKNFGFEIKSSNDEEKSFEAYASTFGNIDLVNDVVEKGAFKKTIKQMNTTGRYAKLLWQHQYDQLPGVFTSFKEDDHGLKVTGRFVDTALGKDVYTLVKSGAISDMSIGFRVKKYTYDEKTDIRTIQEADLLEVSFVTFPANPEANVTGVKSQPQTKKEFEKILREAGFSKTQATAITNKGFDAVFSDRRESDKGQLEALSKSLEKLNQMFKGV